MPNKKAKFKAGHTVCLKSNPSMKLTIEKVIYDTEDGYINQCCYWDKVERKFKQAFLPEVVLERYVYEESSGEDESKPMGYKW